MRRHPATVALIAVALFAVGIAACQPSPTQKEARQTALAQADSAKLAATLLNGQHVFLAYCAMCHGDSGAGDGEVAARFAKEGVKIATLNNGDRMSKLTRDELIRVISQGGGHTQRSNLMPSWATALGTQNVSDVADFIMTLPTRNPTIPEATLREYLTAPEGTPAQGRQLFVHHCVACHGDQGKGDGQFAAQLKKLNVQPRNLTDPAWAAQRTDAQLYAVISLGGGHFRKAVQMPTWTQTLSPAQIRDLVGYVRSLSHTPPKPI